MADFGPPNGRSLQILDHNGRPFERPLVNGDIRNNVEAYRNRPPSMWLPAHLASASIFGGPSRTYWHDRWDEALRNSREDAYAFKRDSRIKALLNERKRSVMHLKWHIDVPKVTDPDQKLVRDVVTAAIESIHDFLDVKSCLLEAIWYGKYAVQWVWGWRYFHGVKTKVPLRWEPLHGDKIGYQWQNDGSPDVPYALVHGGSVGFLKDRGGVIIPTTMGLSLLLRDHWRGRFTIHHHEIEDWEFWDGQQALMKHGVGLRSHVYWTEYLRKEIESWITDFMERVGLGVTMWKYEMGNPTALAEVQDAAKAYDRRVNLFVPCWPDASGKLIGGVERYDPPLAGAEFLQGLMEYFDRQEERLFIGQEGSAKGVSAGLGNEATASFMQDTKTQIAKEDASRFAESMTGNEWNPSLVNQIVRWTEWPNPEMKKLPAKMLFGVESTASEKKMTGLRQLFDMGIDFRSNDGLDAVGIVAPTEGDAICANHEMKAAAKQAEMQAKQMEMGGGMPGEEPGAAGAPGEGGPGPEQPPQLGSFLAGLKGEEPEKPKEEKPDDASAHNDEEAASGYARATDPIQYRRPPGSGPAHWTLFPPTHHRDDTGRASNVRWINERGTVEYFPRGQDPNKHADKPAGEAEKPSAGPKEKAKPAQKPAERRTAAASAFHGLAQMDREKITSQDLEKWAGELGKMDGKALKELKGMLGKAGVDLGRTAKDTNRLANHIVDAVMEHGRAAMAPGARPTEVSKEAMAGIQSVEEAQKRVAAGEDRAKVTEDLARSMAGLSTGDQKQVEKYLLTKAGAPRKLAELALSEEHVAFAPKHALADVGKKSEAATKSLLPEAAKQGVAPHAVERAEKYLASLGEPPPPPQPGMMRLYRGTEKGQAPHEHAFWSDDRGLAGVAIPFAQAQGRQLVYVDVPKEIARQQEMTGAVTEGEYKVPEEFRQQAKPWGKQSGAESPAAAAKPSQPGMPDWYPEYHQLKNRADRPELADKMSPEEKSRLATLEGELNKQNLTAPVAKPSTVPPGTVPTAKDKEAALQERIAAERAKKVAAGEKPTTPTAPPGAVKPGGRLTPEQIVEQRKKLLARRQVKMAPTKPAAAPVKPTAPAGEIPRTKEDWRRIAQEELKAEKTKEAVVSAWEGKGTEQHPPERKPPAGIPEDQSKQWQALHDAALRENPTIEKEMRAMGITAPGEYADAKLGLQKAREEERNAVSKREESQPAGVRQGAEETPPGVPAGKEGEVLRPEEKAAAGSAASLESRIDDLNESLASHETPATESRRKIDKVMEAVKGMTVAQLQGVGEYIFKSAGAFKGLSRAKMLEQIAQHFDKADVVRRQFAEMHPEKTAKPAVEPVPGTPPEATPTAPEAPKTPEAAKTPPTAPEAKSAPAMPVPEGKRAKLPNPKRQAGGRRSIDTDNAKKAAAVENRAAYLQKVKEFGGDEKYAQDIEKEVRLNDAEEVEFRRGMLNHVLGSVRRQDKLDLRQLTRQINDGRIEEADQVPGLDQIAQELSKSQQWSRFFKDSDLDPHAEGAGESGTERLFEFLQNTLCKGCRPEPMPDDQVYAQALQMMEAQGARRQGPEEQIDETESAEGGDTSFDFSGESTGGAEIGGDKNLFGEVEKPKMEGMFPSPAKPDVKNTSARGNQALKDLSAIRSKRQGWDMPQPLQGYPDAFYALHMPTGNRIESDPLTEEYVVKDKAGKKLGGPFKTAEEAASLAEKPAVPHEPTRYERLREDAVQRVIRYAGKSDADLSSALSWEERRVSGLEDKEARGDLSPNQARKLKKVQAAVKDLQVEIARRKAESAPVEPIQYGRRVVGTKLKLIKDKDGNTTEVQRLNLYEDEIT